MAIDISDITSMAHRLASPELVDESMEESFGEIMGEFLVQAKSEAPRVSGRLASSLEVHQDGLTASVEPDTRKAPYALAVLGGSRAHTITADVGKILAFPVGSGTGFAHSVHIPAKAANPFLDRSYDTHADHIALEVEKAYTTLVQKDLL